MPIQNRKNYDEGFLPSDGDIYLGNKKARVLNLKTRDFVILVKLISAKAAETKKTQVQVRRPQAVKPGKQVRRVWLRCL